MAREAVLQGDNTPPEEDRSLRPQSISEMVGQLEVRERLKVVVDAARKRDEPLGHILFDGPPGLGKTTFATCIPKDLGVNFQLTSGPALQAPKDLVPYLTNADERSILFIDEIHRLPKAVEEYLYTAMEDFRIDIVLGEGTNARTINLQIKPFTLIGATTRSGMLTAPLRDRFPLREHLDFYTTDELAEIIRRNASKLDVSVEDDAALEISRRSRGTPRVANNRLRWIRDYVTSKANGHISLQLAHDAMKMQEIDRLGLDNQDRKYLSTIIRVFAGGPAGLEAIAHTMNAAPETLADEVEPFLLRTELVVRTPRGRMVTTKAVEHIQGSPGQKGRTLFD